MSTPDSPDQSHLQRLLGRAWDALPMAALISDQEGTIRYCSDQTSYLLGYDPGQLVGTSLERLVVKAAQKDENSSQHAGPSMRGALAFYARHENGSVVPVDLSLTQVDDPERADEKWTLIIMQDRRPHGRSQSVESEAEKRFRQLYDQKQVGLVWARLNGEILSGNPAAARMFGYDSSEEVEGSSFSDHYRGDPDERRRTIKRLRREGEVSEWNVPMKRRNGESFTILESLVLHRDADYPEPVVVSSFVEVTEQARLWQQLKEMAYHDPLTGLPNRRFFQEQAQKAFALADRRDRHAGVTYLDLDNFKAVNDEWGHEMGDEVLVTLGERAERDTRESDVVARIGGDEFAVLWVDLDTPGEARVSTRRIVKDFEEPIRIGDKTFSLSLSAGIATFPADGDDIGEVLHRADQAMYRAKKKEGDELSIAMTEQGPS